ncbi:hypothetical protein BCM40_06680 [Planococcus donghaensis]|uniref:Uncharacterized protein n=1 Tax=Planococcus donghaensis TaxID=414778 RepID=A0A1C7EGU2_9BACL|nr:hypothetical protein BCM40_06680 [Planococcus donghaensis]
MWMLFEIFTVITILTFSIFIHEMGHAVAVVLQHKKAIAELYFGSSNKANKVKLRLGKITCY